MNKSLVVIIAALIIIGLGVFLIRRFGAAKFDAGYNKAVAENNAAASNASNEAARNLERIIHDTHIMSNDAIDADLIRLGVMRDTEDR